MSFLRLYLLFEEDNAVASENFSVMFDWHLLLDIDVIFVRRLECRYDVSSSRSGSYTFCGINIFLGLE